MGPNVNRSASNSFWKRTFHPGPQNAKYGHDVPQNWGENNNMSVYERPLRTNYGPSQHSGALASAHHCGNKRLSNTASAQLTTDQDYFDESAAAAPHRYHHRSTQPSSSANDEACMRYHKEPDPARVSTTDSPSTIADTVVERLHNLYPTQIAYFLVSFI